MTTVDPLQQCTENVAWQWFLVSLYQFIYSLVHLNQNQLTVQSLQKHIVLQSRLIFLEHSVHHYN